ncbi:MAG TPA: N-acetyltransferase [Actinomycetota bacterium]
MVAPFVPDDFEVPAELVLPGMRLEPLGAEHNERDHEAWSSSIDHIRATPGFRDTDTDYDGDAPWPRPMSLEENLGDLQRHAADFESRRGFTYSVLAPDTDEVIGCVYIYPSKDEDHDARVESWVRASRAELDTALWRGVSDWLDADWLFSRVDYRST